MLGSPHIDTESIIWRSSALSMCAESPHHCRYTDHVAEALNLKGRL